MKIKTAIIIGILGASWSVILSFLPVIFPINALSFLHQSAVGRLLYAIPGITLLIFFFVLLKRQK